MLRPQPLPVRMEVRRNGKCEDLFRDHASHLRICSPQKYALSWASPNYVNRNRKSQSHFISLSPLPKQVLTANLKRTSQFTTSRHLRPEINN